MTSSKPSWRADQHQSRLGGKIGPRIATVVSQAMSDHLRRTSHTRMKIGAETANEFFRMMNREKRAHLAPLLKMYVRDPDLPPELRKLLGFMHSGQGELSELMSLYGTAQALSTPIGAAISNWLAPTNQHYIAEAPHSLLGAGQAAQAYVMGLADDGWTQQEAAKGGLDSYRFELMRQLSEQMPDLASVLELWRRGEISEGEVDSILARMGFVAGWGERMKLLRRVLISPPDAALMALRGIITEDEGRAIAERSGFDHGDFDRLVLATGEPPGVMQLLEAYRRGFIDKERLVRGVKQSRIRDEWVDVVERLRFEPADTSSALRGVIQGHLGNAEGKQIAEWNGLRPEDWDWLVATEGNPPGAMQLMELANRGVISLPEVEQGLRESHVKDKYIPAMLHLRERLPPERLTMQLVTHGGLTAQRALEVLHNLGYHEDIAQAIVKGGLNQQTTRDKALAKGEIIALYVDQGITKERARALLEALGYHATNADLILSLADLRRARAEQKQAIDVVRSAYVARHIDLNEATGELDKIGVPTDQRDYLIALWEIGRNTHRRTLTEAQVVKANTLGLVGDHDAEQRLLDMGYSLEDARILLESEKGRIRSAP